MKCAVRAVLLIPVDHNVKIASTTLNLVHTFSCGNVGTKFVGPFLRSSALSGRRDLSDSDTLAVRTFNLGPPRSVDHRRIRHVVKSSGLSSLVRRIINGWLVSLEVEALGLVGNLGL